MNKLPNIKDILLNTFTQMLEQFSTFFSNFIMAALIFLIGWIVAKIVSIVLKNVLSKIGIDKVGEKLNDIDAIKKFNLDIKISKIVSKIVYVFILLFISVSAADKLGVPAISNMFLMIVEFIPKLISAAIMAIGGLFISDLVKNFVVGLCKSFNIASGKLIGMGVFAFLILITIIAALGQAGINTTLLESSFNIIIFGIIISFSIGYGFASKEILLNIISSFYSKNKFKEGEIIEIQNVKGKIVSIDNTNITIETEGGNTIFPLKVLQTEKVIVYK
jgi:hypothetical protein